MVKHIKGWDLSAKLDHGHNIYVQDFSGAKVGSIKHCIKPCTREKKPRSHISENSPVRVGKSIVDLAKNLFTDKKKLQSRVLYRKTMNGIARQN